MAVPKRASTTEHTPKSPRGELVDLVDLCSRLEDRLLADERDIGEARARGDDTSLQEASWIRMLHRYERVCDLLATGESTEHASAA
jgi:hypothetical protein